MCLNSSIDSNPFFFFNKEHKEFWLIKEKIFSHNFNVKSEEINLSGNDTFFEIDGNDISKTNRDIKILIKHHIHSFFFLDFWYWYHIEMWNEIYAYILLINKNSLLFSF